MEVLYLDPEFALNFLALTYKIMEVNDSVCLTELSNSWTCQVSVDGDKYNHGSN